MLAIVLPDLYVCIHRKHRGFAMYTYLEPIWTAGYSGFVVYWNGAYNASNSGWMIPGTFEYDWDNRFD